MKHNQYTFTAKVWLYPRMAGWHFVTLPQDIAEDIKETFADKKRGWGSIPVSITINNSTWKTSIFPDKQTQSYVFPLKADIRKKEHITEGSTVTSEITIIV